MFRLMILIFYVAGIGAIFYISLKKSDNKLMKNIYNRVLSTANPRSEKIYVGFAQEQVASENMNSLENQLQRPYLIVETYKQWGNKNNFSITQEYLEIFNKAKKIPLITWEPWDPTKGVNQPAFQLKNIINGDYDTYIKETAKNIRLYGKPIFLRLAHEMNADWYPWSGTVNNNTPNEYVAMWRHIYTIFLSEGATNITWVWSPNTEEDDLRKYYPGDAYVDWVGLDGYNWGTSRLYKIWESFSDIFLDDYLSITSLTDKPVMIAETASSENGGSKSDWIIDTYRTQIPMYFPKVTAIVWFNVDRETEWSVDSSNASLNAFKIALSLDIYATQASVKDGKIIPASK
jgi:beta-mannanase